MKTYAIKMLDDSVRITRLYKGTIEEAIAKWPDASQVASHLEITENDVPQDRTFRGAWQLSSGAISHNLTKVRDKIRADRNLKLEEMDKLAFAESRKPNGDTVNIDMEAQRLRDIPQDVRFASNNLLDLKSLYNEI